MRLLTVLLFLIITIGFSQEKSPQRLVNLSKNYIKFDSKQQYDSISKILFDYESLPDLIPIEKQV